MHNADLKTCEVLVVGAGPGGALAAILLARRGVSTGLIDQAVFPRPKLCGGCLARRGFDSLVQTGIADKLPNLAKSSLINKLDLVAHNARARVTVPTYRVLDRADFDHDLLAIARNEGVACVTGVTAQLQASYRVLLQDQQSSVHEISPRVVLVADGIKGTTLKGDPRFNWRVRPSRRLGLGAIVPRLPGSAAPDAITMFHASAGYLGIAPLADGRAVVAAAFDQRFFQQRTPSSPLPALLRHVGLDPEELGSPERVLGVPPLTRTRARVEADGRVFLIGDATGYVEPYTGEGMSWALDHARRVIPIAFDALTGQRRRGLWTEQLGRTRSRQTRLCCMASNLLRRPRVTRSVVKACGSSRLAAGALSASIARLQRLPEKRMA